MGIYEQPLLMGKHHTLLFPTTKCLASSLANAKRLPVKQSTHINNVLLINTHLLEILADDPKPIYFSLFNSFQSVRYFFLEFLAFTLSSICFYFILKSFSTVQLHFTNWNRIFQSWVPSCVLCNSITSKEWEPFNMKGKDRLNIFSFKHILQTYRKRSDKLNFLTKCIKFG